MGDVILLYHAGYDEIRQPDLVRGRKNADFGQGFYLSDNGEFAGRWMREKAGSNAYVNSYELRTEGLNIRKLAVDKEWLSYITANRRGMPDSLTDVDVIIGPIANDTIFDTMGIFTSGFLTDDESLSLLSVGPSYTQIVIKSSKALEQLSWTGARIIPGGELASYAELLKKEEEEYQKELSKVLEDM
jgi:hypothetical protein